MKRDNQLIVGCLLAGTLGATLAQVGASLASRNASGSYSLPTGNPVVTGTTISSTVHNNTMSDLASEMTDSLNRSGKGAMLAPLKLYDSASSTTPDLTWNGDTNTGLSHSAGDTLGLVTGGTLRGKWDSSGLTVGASGTAIADSYAASATINFTTVTEDCEDSSGITVTGASVGDVCVVGLPSNLTADSPTGVYNCFVSATDTVKIRHCAIKSGVADDPGSNTYYVRVFDP